MNAGTIAAPPLARAISSDEGAIVDVARLGIQAVRRGEDDHAIGRQNPRELAHKAPIVADMFDGLQTDDGLEGVRRKRQLRTTGDTQRNRWVGEIAPKAVGAYTVKLVATPAASQASDREPIEASNQFVITDTDLETQTPQADLELLRAITHRAHQYRGAASRLLVGCDADGPLQPRPGAAQAAPRR